MVCLRVSDSLLAASDVSVSYLQCGPGTFSVGDNVTCTDCPEGSASDGVGVSSCKECDAGKFANTTGRTSCQDCAKGTASSKGAIKYDAVCVYVCVCVCM